MKKLMWLMRLNEKLQFLFFIQDRCTIKVYEYFTNRVNLGLGSVLTRIPVNVITHRLATWLWFFLISFSYGLSPATQVGFLLPWLMAVQNI